LGDFDGLSSPQKGFMNFRGLSLRLKKSRRSVLLIGAAFILAVLVAFLATLSTRQENPSIIFAINLLTELFGALLIAAIAGVMYEQLFAKTIVEQVKVHQEKSMSTVGRLVFRLEETTTEISQSKSRMIELLDKGITITNKENLELQRILEKIPVLIEKAEDLHFDYLAEIGESVPTLKTQEEQYLQKKDQTEKFLSAGFLLDSANQKRKYSEVLSTLIRWAKDYPEINFYVAQMRARVGNYQKAIDSLKKVINNESAYKYCIDQGYGHQISSFYKEYQLQLHTK
jgi:hypothetical protein